MALCLIAADASLRIATAAFTLAWSHTVEHQPWQEDWQIAGDRLVLHEVRVKGSGAGMEPPPEAELEAGWYVWRPAHEIREKLVLRRAGDGVGEIGDWQLCPAGASCTALGMLVDDADPVTLEPCP